MNWIELIIHTTTAGSEWVSDILMELGASGTMIEDRADIPDPSKPHGIWEIIDPKLLESMPEDVLVHAWFEPGPTLPALLDTGKETYRQTELYRWKSPGSAWRNSHHPPHRPYTKAVPLRNQDQAVPIAALP